MLRFLGLVLAAIGMAGVAVALQARQTVDVLIRNGRVLDGTGNPWLRTDIAVAGDRIVAIGNLSDRAAARTIDAADRVVAPGFIDVHSHAAEGLGRLALRQGQPLLAQGVT
ncbi:MAG: amidohydrolase family protein, partial [Vicinamibacterales bacterium]